MPTYEYVCQKCGHAFECVQSMKDPALTTCPKESCPKPRWGKGRVRRGIGGGAGLIFKGSGFYITDYRSEGYKSAAKADSSPGSAAPAASESKPKADAKPSPSAAPSKPATGGTSGGGAKAS